MVTIWTSRMIQKMTKHSFFMQYNTVVTQKTYFIYPLLFRVVRCTPDIRGRRALLYFILMRLVRKLRRLFIDGNSSCMVASTHHWWILDGSKAGTVDCWIFSGCAASSELLSGDCDVCRRLWFSQPDVSSYLQKNEINNLTVWL